LLKIAIFTEAGGAYGYGHLTRCTAVADGFAAFGFAAEIFCRGDGRSDWERDGAAFDGCDIVVIDSYTAAIDVYERASKTARVCVWLDDFCRLNYPNGIIHNCADVPLLRKEFWSAAKKEIQKSVQNVFINLGSAPVEFDFAAKAREVFGENINIIKLHNADAIGVRDAMQKADVAISAAGQTLLELASMGVPSVAVITAQSQISNATKLENIGFCKVVTRNALDKTAEYLQSFCAAKEREASSIAGQTYMKEIGALRLAADVLYLLGIKTPRNMLNLDVSSLNIKPFWSLDESERKELLSWRNDDSVRVRMFCKEPISWDEHIKFIETLKSDKTKSYWMAKGVGVISLSKIDFEELKADIGIYKAPNAPKGSGAKLLEVLLDISFKLGLKSVRADVYTDNAAAVKLYERFGFCFVDKYERDGTVAVYELKKEENIV
jgi:UDP-4-amino-4,6-dideoxy-N-acetyl-beta-L-altrosamine N-acetyltransferase